jgi:molybdenum cofactor cytidylyltransferase
MARITVLVLAAGASSRFVRPGTHKLLAALLGLPVIRWSVMRACEAGVGDVVVVAGAEATRIETAVAGLDVRVVQAVDATDGVSASLRRGVDVVSDQAHAVIVALGDQPMMRPDTYRRVVATWQATGAPIVIPRYPSTTAPSHPTLFDATVFGELRALTGDVGARAVIARDPTRVAAATIDWAAPRDIDTIDDLAMVEAEMQASVDQS